MKTLTFNNEGDFQANYAACNFARACGLSVGSMQNTAPRGLLFGSYAISKWRNMNRKEIGMLHGILEGDFREGPVTIRLYDHAPAEAQQRFDEQAAKHHASA